MNKVILFLIFVFILCTPCFAQYNETLTIATYYPSPNGVYRTLRLQPTTQPTTGVDRGSMYFNSTNNVTYVYKNTTDEWQPLGEGFWAEDASTHNIYNTNSGGQVVIGASNVPGALTLVSNTTAGFGILATPNAAGRLSDSLTLDLTSRQGWDFYTRGPAYPGCSQCSGYAFFTNTVGDGDFSNPLNWGKYPITMRPNGNVGINHTVSPQSALDVNGVVRANNANGTGLRVLETYANLWNYHNLVPVAAQNIANFAELMATQAACNRRCSSGCFAGGSACNGNQPGLGYHAGTAVEWSPGGPTVVCGCF